MKNPLKKVVLFLLGVVAAGAIVYAFLPRPAGVDLARVVRGPLRVTVDEDGKTRLKERYTVAAPLAGRLERIQLKANDPVETGRTLLAVVEPTEPELLDVRSRSQAEARVKAAEAASEQAAHKVETARATHELAKIEVDRARQLFQGSTISRQELDTAEQKHRTATEELRAAEHAVQIAVFELELARATLLRADPKAAKDAGAWRLEIRSPITGRVLRVFEESETVVPAGAKLLEVGNPEDLEIVADVLSSDAVKIKAGSRVVLEHWGGTRPLEARVRVVEPSGFTKISALGVEEQRVNVIADFTDPPQTWASIGDGYRVDARFVVFEGANILKIPAGALFRHAREWAVFRHVNGRARLQPVRTGHSSGEETEVLDGLAEGDEVIVYPSDKIREGVRVFSRADGG